MMNLELIPKYAIAKKTKCQICVTAKQTRKPFQYVVGNSDWLDIVHLDICEFGGMLTKKYYRYFITFIDDYSRYCYVYMLKHKDEALEKFIIFKTEAETQTGIVLKRLRSDRDDDYMGYLLFNEFYKNNGIIYEVTPPYTSESNGVANERIELLKF